MPRIWFWLFLLCSLAVAELRTLYVAAEAFDGFYAATFDALSTPIVDGTSLAGFRVDDETGLHAGAGTLYYRERVDRHLMRWDPARAAPEIWAMSAGPVDDLSSLSLDGSDAHYVSAGWSFRTLANYTARSSFDPAPPAGDTSLYLRLAVPGVAPAGFLLDTAADRFLWCRAAQVNMLRKLSSGTAAATVATYDWPDQARCVLAADRTTGRYFLPNATHVLCADASGTVIATIAVGELPRALFVYDTTTLYYATGAAPPYRVWEQALTTTGAAGAPRLVWTSDGSGRIMGVVVAAAVIPAESVATKLGFVGACYVLIFATVCTAGACLQIIKNAAVEPSVY